MPAERMTISMPIWLAQEVRARAMAEGHSMSDELRSLLAAGLLAKKEAAQRAAKSMRGSESA